MDNLINTLNLSEDAQFTAGQCIDGRFEIIRCLDGHRVYLVRDIKIPNCLFALKISSREAIFSEEFNLRREYITHSHFEHPSIVKLLEPFETDQCFGFLMEYVGGGDLSSFLERKGKLGIEQGIPILHSVLKALSEIHSKGFVHADIKPENILISTQGVPKITDFGVSRELGRKLISDASIQGTVKYLCPHYVSTGQLQQSMDVYALGLIAYEMFSGVAPLYSDDSIRMLQLRLREEIPSLSAWLPSANKEVVESIDKALKINPAERFQSANEFLTALDISLDGINYKKSSMYSSMNKMESFIEKSRDFLKRERRNTKAKAA